MQRERRIGYIYIFNFVVQSVNIDGSSFELIETNTNVCIVSRIEGNEDTRYLYFLDIFIELLLMFVT